MAKKILVTGANGVIGSELTSLLLSKKNEFLPLVRKKTKQEHIEFDILKDDWKLLENLFSEVDSVVHLAASINTGGTEKENHKLQIINYDFTEYLLKLSVKNKIKKIIFSSTLSFIQKPLPEMILENSNINPIYYYSLTKYKCEELIKKYSAFYNINYVIIRISSPIIFDIEKMHDNFLKKWILLSKKGEDFVIYGQGLREQDFVATEDVAHAIYLALQDKEVKGIFNIASGTSIALIDIAKLLVRKYKNSFELIEQEGVDEQWNVSIEKAKSELGYSPKYTSEQIIKKIIEIS